MGYLTLPVLRALAWIYYFQPHSFQKLWGDSLGLLLFLTKTRAKVITQNLEFAYPGTGPDKKILRQRFFREAYRHLGQLVFEVLLLVGPMPRYVRRHGRIQGLENWKAAKAQGCGVIFLASHVGNWEVMAATGALLGGVDILLVTKRLKPDWIHRVIQAGRTACRVAATYEPRTMKDILSHLKGNGTVGIVLDQYAGPPVGVRVPVFGIPVGTAVVVAALARRTGAQVLPVVNYRTADGQWVVDMRPPISWEKNDDSETELAVNTARYAAAIEKDIMSHPEQWLWTHRRFKGDLSPLRPEEWRQGRPRS